MSCHVLDALKVALCFAGLFAGTAWLQAQTFPSESAAKYEALLIEVLEQRVQSELILEGNQLRLGTRPASLLKDMRSVVRASVPYYFEGAVADFKRFRPRVGDALERLDGWTLPAPPAGWIESEWRYYQVENAVQDLLLLAAIDLGVFANETLAEGARAREDLSRDWEDLRGGQDALRVDPLPDFGTTARDASSLDGLGTGGSSSSGALDASSDVARALNALTASVDALSGRVSRLESGDRASGMVPDGRFPTQGVDGGMNLPGAVESAGPRAGGGPSSWPEAFTLAFPESSSALGLSAELGLNALIEWMVVHPELRVLVTGHSDASGGARSNMELSRRRAQTVRYYLLERGIESRRVTAAHFGEERPEWGGAFDRRVEVRLLWD